MIRELDEMAHQHRADPARLPGIDHHEGHLGPPGREDDISAAADDDLAAGLLGEYRQRHVVAEVDVQKERTLLVGEMALHHEEPALQRLGAGLLQRRQHVGFVIRPERSNFDRPTVARMFVGDVVGEIRH